MKDTLKKLIPYAFVGVISGATTFGAINYFNVHNEDADFSYFAPKNSDAKYASFNMTGVGDDFVKASKMTVPAVVSIKNYSNRTSQRSEQDLFDQFFGNPFGGQPKQQQVPKDMPSGMGSGVIISPDGYIISNNHVIAGATKLEVVLSNKKSYVANLVGTDPTTDIALLKIEEKGLPYLNFANSDNVEVGQWVLAVGNPMGLNSTVTAGIVSAKARDLDTSGIQSFIQTDAAVNPGNSGGALVNTRGELIGVNTMISSMTGSYVGYSFAVPSNIARKIIEDLMEFGNVQRGILGVEGGELNGTASKELGISQTQGFYINKVTKNSGAEKSGLLKGDIIIKLDEQNVATFADLSGYINTKRPNDKVQVTYIRDGKTRVVPVILSKNEFFRTEFKGIELENIEASDKKKFKIDYGVRIKSINSQNLKQYESELIGNIILSIDNAKATDVETVSKLLSKKEGNQTARIEMINKNGEIIRVIL